MLARHRGPREWVASRPAAVGRRRHRRSPTHAPIQPLQGLRPTFLGGPALIRFSRPLSATRSVTFVAWSAVVLFAVLGIGSPLLGRSVFLGTDLLVQFPPWSTAGFENTEPTNTWIGDTIDAATPNTILLKESTLAGHIAWWNPYVMGGGALGALPDSGVFSPISWPWFVLPNTYAPGAVKLLEIAVAVAGMALFSRRIGLSSAAQAVSGLVFVSSGFMIAWTNWPQTRVAALIPFLFWAVDRAVCLRRNRDVAAIAMVLASMLLGGFPAVVGYAVYAVIAYAAIRLASRGATPKEWLRAMAVGVVGAALGVGLAAWQFVPWAVNASTNVDFAVRGQTPLQHLSWSALATAFVPGLVGDVSSYQDSFWITPQNPIEAFSFLGVTTLVLVAAAFVTRTPRSADRYVKAYGFGAAAIAIPLTYGGGVLLRLAQELPVFSNNYVGRLRVMVGFFIAMCAGYGFHALVERIEPLEDDPGEVVGERAARLGRWLAFGRWAALTLLALVVGSRIASALSRVPPEGAALARHLTVVTLVVAAACGLLVALAMARPRPALLAAAGMIITIVMAGQAVQVVQTWWPRSDKATFYPVTPTHEFLREHLGTDRFVSVSWTLLPATSPYYRLRSATGHAFPTPEWTALLLAASDQAMVSPTNATMTLEGLSSPVLDRMAVRYGVVDSRSKIPGTLVATSTSTSLVETEGHAWSVPITGPVRGVQVLLPAGLDVGAGGELTVSLVTDHGATLTSTSQPVTSTDGGFGAWVALAGEDIAEDESVTAVLDVANASSLKVPADSGGHWAVNVVRPIDDGLKVAFTGDSTVYLRLGAATRFHWASKDRVITDEDARVRTIASGTVPTSTVILERTADAHALYGSSTAGISVVADEGDRMQLNVDASGTGYLIVSESVRAGGWMAQIDGHATSLIPADEAMAAVQVPSGEHVVTFVYVPPGLRVGLVVSASSALVLLAGLAMLILRRRRGSGPGRHVAEAEVLSR